MSNQSDQPQDLLPFELLIRVRYAECDAQNVVFNARYGDYVDLVSTEYFRYTLGDYQTLLKQGIDNQVVRLATDWQSPARFDDVLSLSVTPGRIGNSSYAIAITMREYYSRRLIAQAEVVYVMVTAGEFRKMVIPETLREQLSTGCPGKVIDQTGLGLTSADLRR